MLMCSSACFARLAHYGRGLHPAGTSWLHDDRHLKLPGTTARVHVFLVLSMGRLPLVVFATPETLIQPELGLSVSYLVFFL